MALGAIASALVGVFFDGTALPMLTIMAICSIAGLFILLNGRWRMDREPTAINPQAQHIAEPEMGCSYPAWQLPFLLV